MNAAVVQFTESFAVEVCYCCGIAFGVPRNMHTRYLDKGVRFYCPNGHGQSYQTSTVQKLEDQLKEKQRELEQQTKRTEWANKAKENAINERDHHERRVIAHKGHSTRLRNRIAHGKCPCCSKHFADVERHISKQHPTYA